MLGDCSLHQYTITWLVSKSKIMWLCPLLYHPIICNVIYTRSMQEFEFGFTFLQKHCLLSSGSFRPHHTYTGRRLLKFIKLYNLKKFKWLLRAQLTHMPTAIGYACARRKKYRFICLSASIDVYKQIVHRNRILTEVYTGWKKSYWELLAFCAGNSSVTGELPAQRPVTRSFDIFFDLHLNKRLSKQSRNRWFKAP